MKDDDTRLVALATSVSDGAAVDWENEEARAAREESGPIRQLRTIAEIAEFSRSQQGQQPPDLERTADPIPNLMTTVGRERETVPGAIPTANPISHWGRLEIIEKIGEGHFGEVFRARDPGLDREVALKLLGPRDIDELAAEREAITEGSRLARVRQRNMIVVYGAERQEGRIGIWMEIIHGRTLAELLDEQGTMGAREATGIGQELCGALAALHRAGLVHRDVKAQNVMREAGGRIILMDLGTGLDLRSRTGTEDRTISGTPLYMAPEILRGEPATPRSDIYSLGVLLYHLVTGSYPVTGRTLRELHEAHAAGRMALLRDVRPDLPDAFVRVVERALAPDPQKRYASAGEMEHDLAAALGMLKEGEPPLPRPPAWRRAVALAAAALAVGFVLFLAVRIMSPWRGGLTYKVEAAFRRETPEGSEQLLPGARIAPGDKLFLEFRASTPVHLYVIDQDERGASYLLFPLPDLESKNPLSPNVTHRLPGRLAGKSKEFNWEVSTAGGREHFVIVASPGRLAEFEQEALALARPETGPMVAARLNEKAAIKLRGVGGLAEAEPAAGGGRASRLFEMAARLGSEAEGARGVWVRQFDLENPAP